MNVAEWLRRQGEARGGTPAIYHGDQLVCDYAEWHGQAGRLAAWLRARGVVPGDRVGIFMGNAPGYLIALFGAWYAGAVVVPVNAKLHGREAAWIFENAGAGLVFADGGAWCGADRGGLCGGDGRSRGRRVGRGDGGRAADLPRWRGTPRTWHGCSTPPAPRDSPRA
jgi:acyl-coenzyme A synthetase/AMP-(fatty) acid ligase